MRYLKNDRLYCFSPPVMLATFVIEVCAAIYVLWRYHLTAITRLSVGILAGLALFQLAEYNVCQGAWGIDSLTWSRIGYVAITVLPPLGLHLATRMAGQDRSMLVGSAYGLAGMFSAFFLFMGHGLTGHQCMGNYVIFQVAPWAVLPYTLYYYGLLLLVIGYIARVAPKCVPRVRQALYALAGGYLAFIVPVVAVVAVDPSVTAGIPSIMCGFAVILALVLVGRVLPLYYDNSAKGSLRAIRSYHRA